MGGYARLIGSNGKALGNTEAGFPAIGMTTVIRNYWVNTPLLRLEWMPASVADNH